MVSHKNTGGCVTKPHISQMSNQDIENSSVNGSRPLGEGSSSGRCFLVKQQEASYHQVAGRMKWNKEINKVVMECFYRSKPFDEEGNLSQDTDKECLEHGEIEDCLNQQSNKYMTKQGQLGKMDGYRNFNWKQLKDK